MLFNLALAFTALLPALSNAAYLQQVYNFGTNPTGVGMYVYKPDNVKANPGLIVGIHWCTGTAQAFYSGTQFAQQADKYGFIVIYPQAPPQNDNKCFDVNTPGTLSHDKGGDSQGIASMIRYAIQNYNVDPSKVFVTGHSSGGMMTNVMLGSYPELFKKGASSAGVPFGCMAGSGYWDDNCARGNKRLSSQAWGDLVRNAYPGYNGTRPWVQLYHGTADDTLYFQNQEEAVKQWCNVHGISESPTRVENNVPRSGWTTTTYGNGQVVAIKGQGEPHNIPVLADKIVEWFGLNQ